MRSRQGTDIIGSSTGDTIDDTSRRRSAYATYTTPDGSFGFALSNRIREQALRTLTANRQVIPPALSTVCQTLVRVEQLIFTAKCNTERLAVILENFDAVTRGVLDRWFEHADADGSVLQTLQKLVRRAKAAAVTCNKGRSTRLVLGPKLSRNIADVRAAIVDFAATNNLATTDALYVRNCYVPLPGIAFVAALIRVCFIHHFSMFYVCIIFN